MTRLGAALDDMRRVVGISPHALAEATGVPAAMVLNACDDTEYIYAEGWEAAPPQRGDVMKLAAYFGIPPQWVTRFLGDAGEAVLAFHRATGLLRAL